MNDISIVVLVCNHDNKADLGGIVFVISERGIGKDNESKGVLVEFNKA